MSVFNHLAKLPAIQHPRKLENYETRRVPYRSYHTAWYKYVQLRKFRLMRGGIVPLTRNRTSPVANSCRFGRCIVCERRPLVARCSRTGLICSWCAVSAAGCAGIASDPQPGRPSAPLQHARSARSRQNGSSARSPTTAAPGHRSSPAPPRGKHWRGHTQ